MSKPSSNAWPVSRPPPTSPACRRGHRECKRDVLGTLGCTLAGIDHKGRIGIGPAWQAARVAPPPSSAGGEKSTPRRRLRQRELVMRWTRRLVLLPGT